MLIAVLHCSALEGGALQAAVEEGGGMDGLTVNGSLSHCTGARNCLVCCGRLQSALQFSGDEAAQQCNAIEQGRDKRRRRKTAPEAGKEGIRRKKKEITKEKGKKERIERNNDAEQ